MNKVGLKAFTYSFVITLSAIFAVSSFFAPKTNINKQPTISNKNIVLFIKKAEPTAIKAQPIKKIALTTLAKTEEVKTPQISLPNHHIEPPKPEEVVIMADNEDSYNYDYIHLNIEIIENIEEPKLELAKTTFAPDAEEMTAPKEEIITPEIVIAEAPVELPEIRLSENNIKSIEKIQIASNDLEEEKEQPALLIPLERGTNTSKKNLIVVHDGNNHQVASTDTHAPIKQTSESIKVEEETSFSTPSLSTQWKSMEEIKTEKKNSNDDPWVVTIGNKHAKNNLILESDKNKDIEEVNKILSPQEKLLESNNEVKLAAEMVDNLIIPIPEDIRNRKNLTPQLTSSEENKYIEQSLDQELGVNREDDDIIISDAQGNNIHKKNKGGFFDSITSIFSSKEDTSPDNEDTEESSSEGVIDSISRKIGLKRKNMQILPTEIRLSFQPNRAEISGTTLQWIQAFGKKAAEEETVALEIRLDAQSSPALQHKRLNLLSNILTSRGVGSHKLRIVYTAREANSFVIRTIRVNPKDTEQKPQLKNQNAKAHYLRW